MSRVALDPEDTVTPAARMVRLFRARFVSQAILTAAELGIADLLVPGPKSASELAGELQVEPSFLNRMLRGLAAYGIFDDLQNGSYALNALSETLVTGSPNSVRAIARMDAQDWMGQVILNQGYSIRTGGNAFAHVFGDNYFEYFAENPESGSRFNDAMAESTERFESGIVDSYDFSWAKTVVDIGGGNGAFLKAVLNANENVNGIVADLPEVVAEAERYLADAGLRERCGVKAIDMFEAVPPGADCYTMKRVVHDWHDQKCVKLLRNIRSAMLPEGRVLIIESIIPSATAVLQDIMLLTFDGIERSEAEYATLLEAADLRLERVVGTSTDISIVEAVAA
jgi:hypothetical protein